MDIQQLFEVYAAQDVRSFNMARLLKKQPGMHLNDNSLTFFVFHFLDEYEQEQA